MTLIRYDYAYYYTKATFRVAQQNSRAQRRKFLIIVLDAPLTPWLSYVKMLEAQQSQAESVSKSTELGHSYSEYS